MHLEYLKNTINDMILFETIQPKQLENLHYLAMMAARQNVDPTKFMNKVRGLIDPQHRSNNQAELTLTNAKPGDEMIGKIYGRKVKVTVLESEVRQMLYEGFFSDVGDLITKKLRKFIGDERKEHELVSKAIDKYPALASIHRYAKRAEDNMYDDPNFWALVDKITGNKSNEIKRLAHGTFKRVTESKLRNGLLTECIIVEARMTEVMRELGLDNNTIQGLMQDFQLTDDDYDISRFKGALDAAKGDIKSAMNYLKDAPGKVSSAIGGAIDKVGGAIKNAPGKASSAIGSAVDGAIDKVSGAISGAANRVGGAVKKGAESERVQDENMDFADTVITIAAVLMDVREADATTPAEVNQVINKAVGETPAAAPVPQPEQSPAEVKQSDLYSDYEQPYSD